MTRKHTSQYSKNADAIDSHLRLVFWALIFQEAFADFCGGREILIPAANFNQNTELASYCASDTPDRLSYLIRKAPCLPKLPCNSLKWPFHEWISLFLKDSYASLYDTIKVMLENYEPVVRPDFDGFYKRVTALYDGLRQIQPDLIVRAGNGEDVGTLAEEVWDFLCSVE